MKKSGQTNIMASNNWLQLYHDVLLETDETLMVERLRIAKAAIRNRARQLGETEKTLERKAMGYALVNLAEIQKQR
jgi:hypothetical protein